MEFIFGSLITLITILVASNAVRKNIKNTKRFIPSVSQSVTHEMVKDYIPYPVKPFESQATKHLKSLSTKIMFTLTDAYWIKNNTFYTAKHENGNILRETEKIVDTYSMDKVELDKMIFIVEMLTKGENNDSSNPGN